MVSGPGGVGKGTLVDRLLQLRPELWLSRSWTTRPRRPGEAENAYTWVDRDQFLKRQAAGGFVEWNELPGTGHLYGTPTFDDHPSVVLEIELNGAEQVKARWPEAVSVFIVAPSPEVQAQRLRQRGDDEASVVHRLALGAEEERLARSFSDYLVVNDDLDRAAGELADILDAHQSG
jgi:guanylate kinase